jgi:hypothetical protein
MKNFLKPTFFVLAPSQKKKGDVLLWRMLHLYAWGMTFSETSNAWLWRELFPHAEDALQSFFNEDINNYEIADFINVLKA